MNTRGQRVNEVYNHLKKNKIKNIKREDLIVFIMKKYFLSGNTAEEYVEDMKKLNLIETEFKEVIVK